VSAVVPPLASPTDVIFQWSDATVLLRTPEAVALVGGLGVVHLPTRREIRAAGEALQAALDREACAEVADRSAEVRAVAVQHHLLDAFRPRLEDATVAAFRADLQPLLAAWADPYAADATGHVHLVHVRRQIAEAPLVDCEALVLLGQAVDAMEAAGNARDRAHRERLASIKGRVRARSRLDSLLVELLADLEPQVVADWLAVRGAGPAPDSPEDRWFIDED